jgi:hypothetical protein
MNDLGKWLTSVKMFAKVSSIYIEALGLSVDIF